MLMGQSGIFGARLNVAQTLDNNTAIGFRCSFLNRNIDFSTSSIVTDGLVLHLDAAFANQAAGPYPDNSCTGQLEWYDLTANANDGTLTNFSSCGDSSGWNGDGSPGDPYRIVFDGTDDFIDFGSKTGWGVSTSVSIEAWIKTNAVDGAIIALADDGSINNEVKLRVRSGKIAMYNHKSSFNYNARLSETSVDRGYQNIRQWCKRVRDD
jgi:hypothetical protein